MQHALLTPEQAAKAIAAGRTLLLAGSEELLERLPRGNWIGGTTPDFMTEDGGTCSTNRVFCTELPEEFDSKNPLLRFQGPRPPLHGCTRQVDSLYAVAVSVEPEAGSQTPANVILVAPVAPGA
jgi:hypothetical protein